MSRELRLLPAQVKLCRWAKRRRAVPAWMAMRLGKTIGIKRWAQTRPGSRHVLSVAPVGAISGWLDALKSDGEDAESIAVLTGTRRQREREFERGTKAGARWWIVNWEGLTVPGHKTRSGKPRAVPSEIALVPWDVVILDESTRIRNPKASVTKVVLDTLALAPYRACLSGLPNPEGPEDFVTQMIFLFGEFMGHRSFWTWRQEHMRPLPSGGWVMLGKSLGLARAEVRARSFFMSKSDAGMGSRLVREIRTVALPRAVAREIKRAERDMEVGDELTNNVLVALTWMSQLAGGRFPGDPDLHHDAKLRELRYLATTELRREPLVVAARFDAEISAAEETLRRAGVSCVRVTGKTRGNADRVREFQSGRVRAIVCQPKVLQMGVDLSRSSTTIHLSRWWDYEVNAQFAERTEHPTRREPRLEVDIVATDTVDEDIADAISQKRASARTFSRDFLAALRKRAARD